MKKKINKIEKPKNLKSAGGNKKYLYYFCSNFTKKRFSSPSFKKYNVGWFLLRRSVDLVRVCFYTLLIELIPARFFFFD